jgi:hypothetical protein
MERRIVNVLLHEADVSIDMAVRRITPDKSTRKLFSLMVVLPVLLQGDPQAPVHITAFKSGDIIYLQSSLDKDTVKVGIQSKWGGSIVELAYRSRNTVNHFDHGREVQLALWGGEETYGKCGDGLGRGPFGWNPVQAGDRYGHSSRTVAESVGANVIYTKVVPLEWCPDGKGGGMQQAVSTPVTIEQWVSISELNWRVVRVHYRIEYSGSQRHSNAPQELPAVYANGEFRHFIYYAGAEPWTNDAVKDTTLNVPPPARVLHTTEHWLTLADTAGFGLTVYLPTQYPYGVGRYLPGDSREGSATSFYRPLVTASWSPRSVTEGDYYLIVGNYREARQILYGIRGRLQSTQAMPPFGFVDTPRRGASVSGRVLISGWAIDDQIVSKIDIDVDTRHLGLAELGIERRDLLKGGFVGVSSRSGYQYWLDTRRFPNGRHTLDISMFDSAGNQAFYGGIEIYIKN